METRAVLFTLVFLLPLGAQETQPDAGQVEGVVIDVESQEPVSRATIRLLSLKSGKRYVSSTDSKGLFRLSNLAPGRYEPLVRARGYLEFRAGDPESGNGPSAILAASGSVKKGLRIGLRRPGVIAGLAVDEDGRPFPQLEIEALRIVGEGAEGRFIGGATAKTNDEGEFRIFLLPPGRYIVRARPPDDAFRGGEVDRQPPPDDPEGLTLEQGYLETFYPNVLDPQFAAPIDLGYGERRTGLYIRMQPHRVLSIRGRVVSAWDWEQGSPSVSLNWSALGVSQSAAPTSISSGGAFVFNDLAPGAYVLESEYRAGGLWVGALERIDLTDRPIDDVELRLRPAAKAGGRLRLHDPDVGVHLVSSYVHLVRPDMPENVFQVRAEIDSFGRFTFEKALPATYRVQAGAYYPTARKSYFLEKVEIGGESSPDHEVTIDDSPQGSYLTVRLAPTASLRGAVYGRALESASNPVVLVFQDNRDEPGKPAIVGVGADGMFEFNRLVPGRRRIVAIDKYDRHRDGVALLRRLFVRSEEIEIEVGGKHEIALEVVAREDIE